MMRIEPAAAPPDLVDDGIRHASETLAEVGCLLDLAASATPACPGLLEEALAGLRSATVGLRMALVQARERSAAALEGR